jgi:hypothetical protein
LDCVASKADAVQSVSKLSAVDVSVTLGVLEDAVKPAGIVTVIVEPVTRAPALDAVNPIVQVASASSTNDVGAVEVTVKAVTAVALAVIVSPAEGAMALESAEVATEKFDGPYVAAAPLIIAMVNVAAVLAGNEQVPVLVDRLMVTTLSSLASTPAALQSVANSPVPDGVFNNTVGVVFETVKPRGNVTVMELPDARAPVADVVRPTVQVDAVFSTNDVGAVPVKVTVDRELAPAPVTAEKPMTSRSTGSSRFTTRTFPRIVCPGPLADPSIGRG